MRARQWASNGRSSKMPREDVENVLEHAHEIIAETMNEHAVPGMAVGVVHGGETVYARGFGLADTMRETPVTPQTVFRIGSIGKTMTAIGLMRLWERGEFRLDDPVNGYLRSYRIEVRDPTAPPVTFRHLLTHTSGLGELRKPTDLFRPMLGLGAKPGRPVPEPCEYYAGGLRSKVYPGTRWAYSNHAFATLGQLVEDISGRPFAEHMRENVFGPLGMSNTDYLLSEGVRDRLAQGYVFVRGRLKPVEYLEIAVKGAGSVFSNVEDMNRYVGALLGGGANRHGRVLKAETLGMMMEPHYRLDERLPAMGLAFLLYSVDGKEIAGHDGGWPGFVSSMLLCPEAGLGIVALVNASSATAHEVSEGLLRRMLDVPEPARSLPKKGILESPHLWPELRGFYGPEDLLTTTSHTWLAYAGEIEVRVKGNHLMMRTLTGPLRKGARLYPVDAAEPLAFEAKIEGHPQPVVFGRDPASGRVDRLCIGFDRLRKRPRVRSLRFGIPAGLGAAAGVALSVVAARRKSKGA
jgi:CubicO group peptidase (beta-lactamase class C family)